jgi:hypothetical protein
MRQEIRLQACSGMLPSLSLSWRETPGKTQAVIHAVVRNLRLDVPGRTTQGADTVSRFSPWGVAFRGGKFAIWLELEDLSTSKTVLSDSIEL